MKKVPAESVVEIEKAIADGYQFSVELGFAEANPLNGSVTMCKTLKEAVKVQVDGDLVDGYELALVKRYTGSTVEDYKTMYRGWIR
jgi:hypothetical protein